MKKELNEFTQLFLIAGFYQYLQPKFYDLQRFEFVADWFCDAFAKHPHYVIYDMKYYFYTYIIKNKIGGAKSIIRTRYGRISKILRPFD